MAYLEEALNGLDPSTYIKPCIHNWAEGSLAPCTIRFPGDYATGGVYDDSGGSMTIGGNTCHLCGARTIEHNVNTAEVGKKKHRRTVTTRYVLYACGTDVSRREDERPCVEVGRKCIQFPIPQERW